MDLKLEQCICVKFCFKSGYTATDTFKLLQKVYNHECLPHTTVFEWFGQFCDSCVSANDDLRKGRLCTSRMTENIEAVHTALVQDRRCTIKMHAECFHIDKETVC